jgi:hypothetical protein
MRTLIFTLMLLAVNCLAAPQPTVWLNSWDTNRGVLPVFGLNNLSISNRIAGPGGGTNWDFFGIGAATVARLLDVTNISRSIVSSSNGLYVLRFNGPSDGQIATNLNVTNHMILGSAHLDGSNDTFNAFLPIPNVSLLLNAFGITLTTDDSLASECSLSMNSAEVLNMNSNTLTLFIGNSGPTNIEIGYLTPFLWLDKYGGFPNAAGMVWGDNGVAAGGNIFSNIWSQNFYGTNFRPMTATASKMAKFDANTNLVSSTLAESDIINGLASTNKYILANAGLGTNNTLYSPTNTATASNQVAATFNGLAGQVTNVWEVRSNGVLMAWIAGNGAYSNLNGLVMANQMFSSDYKSGPGGTTFDYGQNCQIPGGFSVAGSGIFGRQNVTPGARLHSTNSTAQAALRVDQIATNDIAAFYRGTTLVGGVSSNGIYSLVSNLVAPTAITFPNSTVNWTNPLNCNIELYIDNTAVTGTAIKKNGTQIFGGLSNDVIIHLQPGEFFSETYSVGTPSATFSPF